MATPSAPDEGPYRRSARQDEGPARRASLGFVTSAGALVILLVVGFAIYGALRELRREDDLASTTHTFASLLTDPRLARIARESSPVGMPMPDPPALSVGEQADAPFVSSAEPIDGAPELGHAARGVLVTDDDPPELDAAQLGRSRRAAETPQQVRFVGVIAREVIRGAYRYGAVSVDVERASVVIVDLATERPVTRITIQAAPPGHSSVARDVYPLEDGRVWQAIERALR